MSTAEVLLPVFVQVALILVLVMWTGFSRVRAIRAGETKMKDVALGQHGWPEKTTKIGNAYENQLQLPMLFLALVTLALIARKADFIFVAMSWLFVMLRLVHAWQHIGRNHMPHRFYAFLAGVVVLFVMWLRFALQILWVY